MIIYRHGLGLGCTMVELCWNGLFVQANRQFGEARRRKTSLSADISVVIGSGRVTSVSSSDFKGGYRSLACCQNLIVGSNAMGCTKPWTAFGIKQRRRVGILTKQHFGTIAQISCYHGAEIRDTEFKSVPGERRVASRRRST